MPYKLIEIDPVAKPRMTQRDRWKLRPCVLKYHQYCDRLRTFDISRIDWESLDVGFTIPMPQSWSEKKRARMMGTAHRQRPDLDNLLKAFMDACLPEDCKIWNIKTRKIWGIKGEIFVKLTEM